MERSGKSTEKKKNEKESAAGRSVPFYLGLVQGLIWFLLAVVITVISLLRHDDQYIFLIMLISALFGTAFIVLGKYACNHKGAAIGLVVLSTVIFLVGGVLFASFGFAGGIVGIVKNQKEKPVQPAEEEGHEPAETVDPAETGASSAETTTPVLEEAARFPKKKYKARLNFGSKSFVLAVILWALSLCGSLLVPLSAAIFLRFAPEAWLPLCLTGLILFFVAGDIAHLVLNYLDEKEPRKAVRVFWWLSLPPYACTISFIFMMIAAVGMLYKVITGNYEPKPKGEKLFVVYDNGYERKLKRAEGSEIIAGTLFYRYVDDIGNHWLSSDERTFYKKKHY